MRGGLTPKRVQQFALRGKQNDGALRTIPPCRSRTIPDSVAVLPMIVITTSVMSVPEVVSNGRFV